MSNNSLSKHNSIQSKETLGDKINNKNKDINDNKVTKKACDKTPTHQTSIKSFTKPNIPPYTSPPLTFSNHTKKDKNYQKQLVTDYFTVVKRSSLRKCKTDIENEKNNQLEEQIISQFEEGLKIVELPGKGRGVLAEKKFYRGDFIVEYAGDLIDLKEAKLRDTRYKLDRNIGCYMYYFEVAGKHYCVDATPETDRKGRLLNHSCKTFNCKTKAVWVRKLKLPKLILMATRDIEIGEELLYDYGERDKEAIKAHPWLKE
ncbi:unnamed protein product [Gordionus sp. m RMFG-2023]